MSDRINPALPPEMSSDWPDFGEPSGVSDLLSESNTVISEVFKKNAQNIQTARNNLGSIQADGDRIFELVSISEQLDALEAQGRGIQDVVTAIAAIPEFGADALKSVSDWHKKVLEIARTIDNLRFPKISPATVVAPALIDSEKGSADLHQSELQLLANILKEIIPRNPTEQLRAAETLLPALDRLLKSNLANISLDDPEVRILVKLMLNWLFTDIETVERYIATVLERSANAKCNFMRLQLQNIKSMQSTKADQPITGEYLLEILKAAKLISSCLTTMQATEISTDGEPMVTKDYLGILNQEVPGELPFQRLLMVMQKKIEDLKIYWTTKKGPSNFHSATSVSLTVDQKVIEARSSSSQDILLEPLVVGGYIDVERARILLTEMPKHFHAEMTSAMHAEYEGLQNRLSMISKPLLNKQDVLNWRIETLELARYSQLLSWRVRSEKIDQTIFINQYNDFIVMIRKILEEDPSIDLLSANLYQIKFYTTFSTIKEFTPEMKIFYLQQTVDLINTMLRIPGTDTAITSTERAWMTQRLINFLTPYMTLLKANTPPEMYSTAAALERANIKMTPISTDKEIEDLLSATQQITDIGCSSASLRSDHKTNAYERLSIKFSHYPSFPDLPLSTRLLFAIKAWLEFQIEVYY